MSDGSARSDPWTTERRRAERVTVEIRAQLLLEDRPYDCSVLNMSSNGMLLKFDNEPDRLTLHDPTGKVGTVILGIGQDNEKSLHGTIVRFLSSDDVCVAALSVVS
ncbi:MAG TPA: PilZ domain-containing protein [Spirochaetia bacterium]|nr:PilZ domain-containing protein [Spirochaetia bacterium]